MTAPAGPTSPPLPTAAITLRVIGEPAPQGSKTAYIRGGRAVLAEAGSKTGRARHADWRQAIATAARDHLQAGGQRVPDRGPLTVDVLFLMPKPPSRPKREVMVQVKPDLDKLCRALLDGLASGGLLAADQRVAELHARKQYAAPGQSPGCTVDISWDTGGAAQPHQPQVAQQPLLTAETGGWR